MKHMVLMLAVCVGLLWGNPAAGGFWDGYKLLEFCLQEDTHDEAACFGYVAGIADVLDENDVNGYSACLPLGTSLNQVRDIVTDFLDANPDLLDFISEGLVAEALADAFPCS